MSFTIWGAGGVLQPSSPDRRIQRRHRPVPGPVVSNRQPHSQFINDGPPWDSTVRRTPASNLRPVGVFPHEVRMPYIPLTDREAPDQPPAITLGGPPDNDLGPNVLDLQALGALPRLPDPQKPDPAPALRLPIRNPGPLRQCAGPPAPPRALPGIHPAIRPFQQGLGSARAPGP